MTYKITGQRVPAVRQPVDAERARREATEMGCLAAGAPPAMTPVAEVPRADAPRARARVKRGKGQRRQRTVRLPLELDARLERIASSMGLSVNEAIRAAIIVAYGGQ